MDGRWQRSENKVIANVQIYEIICYHSEVSNDYAVHYALWD